MKQSRIADRLAAAPTDQDAAGDEDIEVGQRLRQFRRAAGLRLRDVAEAADCSESMLSKLENGQVSPSINMLHRITRALGVNISNLFAPIEQEAPFVQRAGQRPVLGRGAPRVGPGLVLESLTPHEIHGHLQGLVHVLAPGASSDGEITHEGEEVGYVLEGRIALTVSGKTAELNAGDSFFFDSERPHSYRNLGSTVARVLWINSPPTY